MHLCEIIPYDMQILIIMTLTTSKFCKLRSFRLYKSRFFHCRVLGEAHNFDLPKRMPAKVGTGLNSYCKSFGLLNLC